MADPWADFVQTPAALAAPAQAAADPWADFIPAQTAPVAEAAPAPAPAAPREDTMLRKASRAFSPLHQGLTLGFGDELVSALFGITKALTGGSYSEGYNYAQRDQRQQLEQQRAENPLASIATETAGGVGLGAAAATSGATMVGRMANNGMSNLIPRMLAGAGEGAAYAGLAGAGGADGGIKNRLKAAAANAPLGAGLGAAAVPVADAVSGIGGVARNVVTGWRNPTQRADELLVKRIMQDRTTPDALAAQVEGARVAGQPEYRAVDAGGRNLQRLGGMAAATPGEFREAAPEAFAARQADQGARIGGFVDQAIAPGGAARATEQQLAATRRANAATAFQAADAAPAPGGQFYDEMMARPSVQDAMRTAERIARERQTPLSDVFHEVPAPTPEDPTAVARTPTARGWRYIKEGLDAQVNAGYASTDAAARANAEAVKETRNQLREQLATDNPAYGAALQRYSDDRTSEEAVQAGRDLIKARNPDEASAAFRDLGNPQDQQSARIGASREIGADLQNRRAGQDKTLAFDTPNMNGKLDMLIEDPTVRALFGERLGRERDMVRSSRAMLGGSNTAEKLAEGADVRGQGGALVSLLMGKPVQALTQAAAASGNAVARSLTGLSEPAAQRVGQYVMSNDPNQIRSLADMFRQAQAAAAAPPIGPTLLAAGLNAPRHPSEYR